MNPDFRLVALAAASLGLIVSVFLALRPDGEPVGTTAAATTESAATDDVVVVRTFTIRVPADTAPAVQAIAVDRGQNVKLVIDSDLSDEVHLHGYDLTAEVGPRAPARIEFTADAPGRFELELEERGLEIAELEVRP